MRLIERPEEMRAWVMDRHGRGVTVGLVPTMGALHEGHLSLMRAAVQENGTAVASIFVNPTQFGPDEDYERYPRAFEADCQKAEAEGIAAIYAPDARTMYPLEHSTYVEEEALSRGLCGRSRPGHFRGVTTVVAKLFNAVLPTRAYFGQKDAQQCAVIRRMAWDLDFGVEIIELPIVREADGLALSSRNQYLSPEERQEALGIHRGLRAAEALLKEGARDAATVVQAVKDEMGGLRIDYVELLDAHTLEPLATARGTVLLAVAAWAGGTRLIDNLKTQVI